MSKYSVLFKFLRTVISQSHSLSLSLSLSLTASVFRENKSRRACYCASQKFLVAWRNSNLNFAFESNFIWPVKQN